MIRDEDFTQFDAVGDIQACLEQNGVLMEQGKQQEPSFGTILLRLRELTKERKLVEKADDTFSRLFAPLLEQSEKAPTWEEHRYHVDALAAEIPDFSVWWEPRQSVYVLIPSIRD